MKKITMALFVVSGFTTVSILTSCKPKIFFKAQKNRTASIADQATVAIRDTKLKHRFKTLKARHYFPYDGKEITIFTEYGIEKQYANDWMFTAPSTVTLTIKAGTRMDDFDYQVNSVRSDVSAVSDYAGFNGLRQDSYSKDYTQLKRGGVDIDSKKDFTSRFHVNGINRNSNSVRIATGHKGKRITEDYLHKYIEGGELRTTWKLLITDKKSGKQYMQEVVDSVGLAYKFGNEKNKSHQEADIISIEDE